MVFGRKNKYSLYITFLDKFFSIPILNEPRKILNKEEIEINMSKIYYFFTNSNNQNNCSKKELKKILTTETIDIRFVLNDDFNNPISSCQTILLNYLDFDDDKSIICKKTLNFFSSDKRIKYFICHVSKATINIILN